MFEGEFIESSDDNDDFPPPDDVQLVAGTAWLFAKEDMDQTLDYLFIDEAGQVALADALAVGTAARNLVLLGDPLQLAAGLAGRPSRRMPEPRCSSTCSATRRRSRPSGASSST